MRRDSIRRAAGAFGLGSLLISCGATLGRVPFTEEGEKETVINVDVGELRFWTELDAHYSGDDMYAAYEIELVQGGALVDHTTCNPFDLGGERICMERILVGGTHILHCRMACNAYVRQAGPTVVRVRFSIPGRPRDLRLTEANVVIKQ